MLFTCAEEFYTKAANTEKLTREEEKILAKAMKEGDGSARERLIQGYFPLVAARLKRTHNSASLDLIYHCISALEKAVDGFDFLQDNEPFSHRLSLLLNKEISSRIARE